MKPEQMAEEIISDFLEIVKDMGLAKECATLCVEKIMSEADYLTTDWWKEVLKAIKQY